MKVTPLYDSCYQQEDGNDILLQLLKAKISTDESTGIRTLDCGKDVFRQEDGCVIARDGERLLRFVPPLCHVLYRCTLKPPKVCTAFLDTCITSR